MTSPVNKPTLPNAVNNATLANLRNMTNIATWPISRTGPTQQAVQNGRIGKRLARRAAGGHGASIRTRVLLRSPPRCLRIGPRGFGDARPGNLPARGGRRLVPGTPGTGPSLISQSPDGGRLTTGRVLCGQCR
jgi:hypothetical protein